MLAVLKLFPIYIAFIVFFYALFLDIDSLKIDYFLLFTLLLFFAISDNVTHCLGKFNLDSYTFEFALILSQIISNVPATLVLADFTKNWQALLWGVNVGGFGLLWGSLASLISYKF